MPVIVTLNSAPASNTMSNDLITHTINTNSQNIQNNNQSAVVQNYGNQINYQQNQQQRQQQQHLNSPARIGNISNSNAQQHFQRAPSLIKPNQNQPQQQQINQIQGNSKLPIYPQNSISQSPIKIASAPPRQKDEPNSINSQVYTTNHMNSGQVIYASNNNTNNKSVILPNNLTTIPVVSQQSSNMLNNNNLKTIYANNNMSLDIGSYNQGISINKQISSSALSHNSHFNYSNSVNVQNSPHGSNNNGNGQQSLIIVNSVDNNSIINGTLMQHNMHHHHQN